MMSDTGLVGFPLAAMKQAMHSAESSRIMLLPYDTLVNRAGGGDGRGLCLHRRRTLRA